MRNSREEAVFSYSSRIYQQYLPPFPSPFLFPLCKDRRERRREKSLCGSPGVFFPTCPFPYSKMVLLLVVAGGQNGDRFFKSCLVAPNSYKGRKTKGENKKNVRGNRDLNSTNPTNQSQKHLFLQEQSHKLSQFPWSPQ